MSGRSRIRSPARSQGSATPRRSRLLSRNSAGQASPGRSLRLSSVVQLARDADLSASHSRLSVLSDNTDILEPRRKSWWNNLQDNSRDTLLGMCENNENHNATNIMEDYIEAELPSQEDIHDTFDLLESSGSESVCSIVLPERRLFTKTNAQQTKFKNVIDKRELQKTLNDSEKTMAIIISPKKLFQKPQKRTRPHFPETLLNVSSVTKRSTVSDKELQKPNENNKTIQVEVSPKKLFQRPQKRARPNYSEALLNASDVPSKATVADEQELEKTLSDIDNGMPIEATSKTLFQRTQKRTRPNFPEALLNISGIENKTIASDKQDLHKTVNDNEKAKEFSPKKLFQRSQKRTRPVFTEALLNLSEITNKSAMSDIETMNDKDEKQGNGFEANAFEDDLCNDEETNDEVNNFEVVNEENNAECVLINENANNDEVIETNNVKEVLEHYDEKSETKHESEIMNDDDAGDESSDCENQMDVDQNEEECENTNKSEDDEEDVLDDDEESKIIEESDIIDESEGEEEGEPFESENQEVDEENEEESPVDASSNDGEAAEGIEVKIALMNESKDNDQNEDIVEPENQGEIEEDIEEVNNINESANIRTELNVPENEFAKGGEQMEPLNEGENEEVIQSNIKGAIDEELNILENEVAKDDGANMERSDPLNKSKSDEKNEEVAKSDSEGEINEELNESDSKGTKVAELIESLNESENNEEDEEIVESDNQEDVVEDDEENEAVEENDTMNESENTENEQLHQSMNQTGVDDDGDHEEACAEEVIEANNHDLVEDNEESKIMNTSDDNEDGDQEDNEESDGHESEINNDTENNESNTREEQVDSESEQLESEDDDDIQREGDTNDAVNDYLSDKEDAKPIEENIPNKTQLKSPEVVLKDATAKDIFLNISHEKIGNSRKTKDVSRPSDAMLVPTLMDMSKDSSEGSWDSHRVTKKSIRRTFGADVSRKSLRTLVMERSAKRLTTLGDLPPLTPALRPNANSTEISVADFNTTAGCDLTAGYVPVATSPAPSPRTKQMTLISYLEKIKQNNLEKKLKIEEEVRSALKRPERNVLNSIDIYTTRPRRAPAAPAAFGKPTRKKAARAAEALPDDVRADLAYRPPRRFAPPNTSWATKRLYRFLEDKLEPKFKYKARVKAERLVGALHEFCKTARRPSAAAAPGAPARALRRELAAYGVVRTHADFYEFFHEFLPRDVRNKVIPDAVNKIPLPAEGIYAQISRED